MYSYRYLGLSSVGVMHDETCKAVPGLVFKQLEVCENNPESILCISQGARRAIMECQSQFKNERWNCTTNKNQTVFGQIIAKGKRCTLKSKLLTLTLSNINFEN